MKMAVKLVCTLSPSTLYCIVKVEPLCILVIFRVKVLLTEYTPHSFCTTVFTGHDYSALSHAKFTVSYRTAMS